MYGGGLFTAYSGDLVCIVKARSALQIWKARVCISGAHGVRGFLHPHGRQKKLIRGMAGKSVVAYGRLPSPDLETVNSTRKLLKENKMIFTYSFFLPHPVQSPFLKKNQLNV